MISEIKHTQLERKFYKGKRGGLECSIKDDFYISSIFNWLSGNTVYWGDMLEDKVCKEDREFFLENEPPSPLCLLIIWQ